MATKLQDMMMEQVEKIAAEAMAWIDKNIMFYAVPEAERPTPWQIFGKDGEQSDHYKSALNDLSRQFDGFTAWATRRLNDNTWKKGDRGISQNNLLDPLKELLGSCGTTPKQILDAFLDVKKQDEERRLGLNNPLNWQKFNQISSKYQANVMPVDVRKAFRRIVKAKVKTEKRSHEFGDLDPERFSRYYTGDVFTQQKIHKPKLAVYVYADGSGSMNWPMGVVNAQRQADPNLNEVSRKWVANNILAALFSALEEVSAAGVRWQFAVWGGSEISIKKKLDAKVRKSEIDTLYMDIRAMGGTRIEPVVDDWKKIKPTGGEKVIIIVLTDGAFSEDYSKHPDQAAMSAAPYDYVRKNITRFAHIWIPICFDPTQLGIPVAENLFKGVSTLTEQDVNFEILRQFKKALDKLL